MSSKGRERSKDRLGIRLKLFRCIDLYVTISFDSLLCLRFLFKNKQFWYNTEVLINV